MLAMHDQEGVALLPLPHGPGKDALKISEVLPFEKSQMDDILLTIGWTTIPSKLNLTKDSSHVFTFTKTVPLSGLSGAVPLNIELVSKLQEHSMKALVASLLLVAMPGAPRSVRAPSSIPTARSCAKAFGVMPGAVKASSEAAHPVATWAAANSAAVPGR